MTPELDSQMRWWLGAATLALGVGAAALAGGSGVAQAATASTGSPGPAKPSHHQTVASHSTALSAKKKSASAQQAAANPDLPQSLSAQQQAITAQGQKIAAQGQTIANEQKTFGTQLQNSIKTTNFLLMPPRIVVTEFYNGANAVALLEAAQLTNGFAKVLNQAAQGITTLETAVVSQPSLRGPLSGAIYTAATPIATVEIAQANSVGAASRKFLVAAEKYEATYTPNFPPRRGTTPAL